MNHYFTENYSVLTHDRTLELNIWDFDLKFLSNKGLFACDKIDKASIIMLENLPSLSGSVLDMGCGYGTLGIALAKKYGVTLTMADINSIALKYAEQNAALNGIKATFVKSDCFKNITGTFDTIVLNPPIHAGKDIMFNMYENAINHLNYGGALYVVIYKKHGAESSMKKIQEVFGNLQILYKKNGLFVLEGIRQSQS